MADDYKPGETINITIEGAIVVNTFGTSHKAFDEPTQDTGTVLVFRHPDEAAHSHRSHTVNLGAAGVTVERADPEWWPPRPADVLRHTETRRLWFGVAHASNLCLYASNGDCMDPQQTWEQRHRLEIVHREEPTRG